MRAGAVLVRKSGALLSLGTTMTVELKNLDGKVLSDLDTTMAGLRRAMVTADGVLKSADRALESADGVFKNTDANLLGKDAPAQQELRDALQELTRAARSLRVLTDYLERHPESLLRGKTEEKP